MTNHEKREAIIQAMTGRPFPYHQPSDDYLKRIEQDDEEAHQIGFNEASVGLPAFPSNRRSLQYDAGFRLGRAVRRALGG